MEVEEEAWVDYKGPRDAETGLPHGRGTLYMNAEVDSDDEGENSDGSMQVEEGSTRLDELPRYEGRVHLGKRYIAFCLNDFTYMS